MNSASLQGGFTDTPREAAFAFRALLNALAHPGRIFEIEGATPPAPLSPAAGAVMLTLCDRETPIHLAGPLDCAEIRDWATFQCSSPIVPAEDARFAFGAWEDLAPLDRFAIGTPEYPDRSATLVIERGALANEGSTLTGPGIRESQRFALPEELAFQRNAKLFPLGLDFIFTAGSQIAGLPRTTKVRG